MTGGVDPARQPRRRATWRAVVVVAAAVLPLVLMAIGLLPAGFGLLTLTVIVTCLIWLVRAHAVQALLVFLLVALVATIVERPWLNLSAGAAAADDGNRRAATWAASAPFDDRLPIVLHLVFDELMSPGAIDPSLAGATETIDAIRRLSDKHGLRLYDSVYSRFYYSAISIPNMMHAEYLGRSSSSDLSATIANPPADNAYFADLAGRGYRSAVFETSVVDFCLPRSVTLCEVFASYDPAVAMASGLDDRTRAVYLWDTLLRAYEPGYMPAFGRWLIRRVYGLDQRELGVLGAADRFDVQGFPGWFDRFQAFVSRAPRGSHIFAHFLVPHSPYLLTDTCVVSGEFDSGYGLKARIEDPEAREGARRSYYEQYLRQTRCVVTKVDALLTAIADNPAFADALIVIHGDHGSRISAGALTEEVGPRDLIDNHAAFFAARGPGIEAGTDCSFLSLPQVFRRTMRRTDQTAAVAEEPLPLLVGSQAGSAVRVPVPMPVFGCASTGEQAP